MSLRREVKLVPVSISRTALDRNIARINVAHLCPELPSDAMETYSPLIIKVHAGTSRQRAGTERQSWWDEPAAACYSCSSA